MIDVVWETPTTVDKRSRKWIHGLTEIQKPLRCFDVPLWLSLVSLSMALFLCQKWLEVALPTIIIHNDHEASVSCQSTKHIPWHHLSIWKCLWGPTPQLNEYRSNPKQHPPLMVQYGTHKLCIKLIPASQNKLGLRTNTDDEDDDDDGVRILLIKLLTFLFCYNMT